MKKYKLFIFILISMLFLMPCVEATEGMVNDSNLFNTVEGFGAYIADECNVMENINGTSAILGETVNVLGKTDGISFVLGDTVNVYGSSDYLFLLGNNVTIDTEVEKEAFILGVTLKFAPDNILGRDSFILGEDITLSGTVGRNTSIVASTVRIEDASIMGDIDIDAENIIISGDTNILGELSYYENANIDTANTVSINSVNIKPVIVDEEDISEDLFETKVTDTIYSWGAIIVVFLILVFATPSFKKVNKILVDKFTVGEFFKTAGIGLLILIATPFALIILLCTIIGIPVALIALVLYIISIWLSSMFTGYVLAKAIFGKLLKKNIHDAIAGIAGFILVSLLTLIPTVGGIVSFISLIFGMGAFICIFKKLPNDKIEVVEVHENKEEVNVEEKV